jgi:signal transduction histidine kinase
MSDKELSKSASSAAGGVAFLAGRGELGALLRAFDWRSTPLGPTEGWPQSLRTAVSLMLANRYPMFIWWGPEQINIYNDAYAPILGKRHPDALGRRAAEIWADIWDVVGLQAQAVVTRGEATWNDRVLLVMERNGWTEETYFTFSYSPVLDESGTVGGMLGVCTEETRRVLGERRLKVLRDLGEHRGAETRTAREVCEAAAAVLEQDPHDLPFALIYLLDREGRHAELACRAGLPDTAEACPESPERVALGGVGDEEPWPFSAVLATGAEQQVDELPRRFGRPLPGGPWPESASKAVVLPLARAGESQPWGFLVLGVSPRLAFDDEYKDFFHLIAGQVATAIASAQAFEDTRRKAEALAELDRAKTAFFSNVSHEFRTPLTLMLGPLEEILAQPETAEGADSRALLSLVHRNGLRLQRLVNMLLDFSRIEAGRVQASYEPVDLSALTGDLVSAFRSACEKAGLALTVQAAPLPEPVYVDRDMWEKVVLNLVSNAFKFTLEGGIEVALRAVDGKAELTVRDTGAGIPPQEMPRLFERFHRVLGTPGRTQEGTGIGLALVQELVQLHGGEVRAESELGRGTTFFVTLPFGKGHLPADRIGAARTLAATPIGSAPFVLEALRWMPDPPDRIAGSQLPETSLFPVAVKPTSATPRRVGRPRILLADDNRDMRDYIRRLLCQEYEVTAVADGAAALRAARTERPDLVLTDVMMPGLDGFGLLRELRADPETQSLPVILLSARAGEESRVEGLGTGADDYLVKPFSARELLARVARHVLVRQALAEADRRKDEFLATLAHELRNPLAPIRNMLELMKLAGEDGKLRERARATMERQLSHMVRLIDDLLDVSRISRGKLELKRERVELAPVVYQAVEACRPHAASARHEINVTLPPEPIYLNADPVRLAQVFGNLLNNACKYTDPGGKIWLKAERQEGDVVVRIRDTGIGIPPDKLVGIFEMFAQVDRTLERSQGGLGIGLTLAKRLVEMHAGTVTAHSEGLGRGSEFVVRLPLLLAPPRAEEDPESAAQDPTAGRRILIVDDNQDSAMSLAMLLEVSGHEARTAFDGLQAVDAAAEFRPDVVLMDLGMPKLNGYDAAVRIRQQPWGERMILVAVTGWGQEEDRRRTTEAGFDGHLVKPVDYGAFKKLLASLLTREPQSARR